MTAMKLEKPLIGGLIPEETIADVVQTIADNCLPEKIILFGSYATGNPTPDSDLDILVIMASEQPQRVKRAIPIHQLFRPKPCSMDIMVYTPSEVTYWNGTANHIVTEALRTGKVLYERR